MTFPRFHFILFIMDASFMNETTICLFVGIFNSILANCRVCNLNNYIVS